MNSIAPADTSLVSYGHNEKVEELEKLVLQVPQVDLRTSHVLEAGIYARTIYIPAGTVLTGAKHKQDHVNIVMGDITVTTDDGVKRLTGYHVIPTKAGTKGAGYAHSDTCWTTICKTELTDIEAIEDELVEDSTRLQTRQQTLGVTKYTVLEN